MRLRIGPVSATFAGKVTLSDIDPPNGYRISGEGQGGVAGFAKGGAVVTLRDDGGATVLDYNVDAQVGGKIAQVGARLIDGHGTQAGRRVLRQVRRQGRRAAAGRAVAGTPIGDAERSAAGPCRRHPLQRSAAMKHWLVIGVGAAVLILIFLSDSRRYP